MRIFDDTFTEKVPRPYLKKSLSVRHVAYATTGSSIRSGPLKLEEVMSKEVLIRDFFYLDSEMLRSFTAQVLGGIPESASLESEHGVGASGKAEAGLFNFLKASGELDYQYRRLESETMSLHHQVYTRFEQALVDLNALELLDNSFDFENHWRLNHFADGAFVKIRGRVQLADYSKTLAGMEGFPKLIKAFTAVQMTNIKDKTSSGEITVEQATEQRRELTETENLVKKLPVENMVAVARTLYSQGDIRIKAQPAGAPNGYVLAGTGRVNSMLMNIGPEGLVQTPESARWTAVGQILAGTTSSVLTPMSTGNEMEDSFEQVSASLREMVKVGNAAKFPAFEFIPLAVYREVDLNFDF